MRTKIFTLAILLLISPTFFIYNIDPISIGGTLLAKKAWDYMGVYWYAEQTEHKRILKKYLDSNTFHSTITESCNENFTNNCTCLAQYFVKKEEYDKKKNRLQRLEIQRVLTQETTNSILQQEIEKLHKEVTKENSHNISYFQSLTNDEQSALLTLEENIVMENVNPRYSKEELENLHNAIVSE